VGVEVADQIVVVSNTNISSEIKDWLRPDLIGLVESRDHSNTELLRLLSHKISLYIREDDSCYFISKDPVALAKATADEPEAKQVKEQNLGSLDFELKEL
jgi:hypothetical protein